MGSRSKETAVVLLDVSPSMHPHLPETVRCLQSFLQQKLLTATGQKDEVGLVLFGCDETDNDLNESLGGYEGVVVAKPIQAVNLTFVKQLDDIVTGHGAADFLDAVVVGLGLIIERGGDKKLSGRKRLWLLTNLESPVKEPSEGTIDEQAATIAGTMLNTDIKLDVTRIHFKQEMMTSASIQNEILLHKLVGEVHGDMQVVSSALALSGTLATVTPSKAPVTTYRGPLEISPSLKVNIWCYKKTVEAKIPSLKGYSDRAPSSDPTASHDLERITAYKSSADPDREVPPAEHTKAYRYGPQFIPVDQHVEEGLKFRADKGVKVIGFTHSKHIPRHLFMKDSNVFIAEPNSEKAAVAFSAVVRAMHQTNRVAILRCVYRANQGSVALSVGTPCPAEEDHLPDSLIVNQLPFAEDVREYPFLALSDQPESKQPSLDQMDLAERLVRTLDLNPPGGEELLQPESTPNPTLERFYSFLHKRAMLPDAQLPPITDTARAITAPPPRLLQSATPLLEDFQATFNLAVAAIEDKPSKRFWRDRREADDEAPAALQNEASASGTAAAPIALDDLAARKVEEVGSVNPVQDFNAMIARTDDASLIPKAITGMKDIIDNLVSQAYQGNTYDQAVECLRALRRGCIVQSEPLEFNGFLRDVAARCKGKRQHDFWERLVKSRLTLIDRDEEPDSDVTKDEAEKFLTEAEAKPPSAAEEVEANEEVDEMAELLDMAE